MERPPTVRRGILNKCGDQATTLGFDTKHRMNELPVVAKL
jgi:hypothetical protein